MATGYRELPEPDPVVVEEKRKKIFEEARENILQGQKKQKEQYDKNMPNHTYFSLVSLS